MPGNTFDVIVLGGGPAGLGSAISLADKGISVLLLEKDRIAATRKTWLTFDYIIDKYGLQDCVRNTFSEVIFSCYLGNNYSFDNPHFISPLYEEKALESLARQAIDNGAVVKEQEAFVDYSIDEGDGSLTIRTTEDTYHARIALDAMGRKSDILSNNGLSNDILDMGCLAFFLKDVNHRNDNKMILFDSFFPGSDYFWLVPLEGDKMMAGIFFFAPLTESNTKEKTAKLKSYIQSRNISGEIYDTRKGNIPLGGQNSMNTGNFLCIGDSCNTPLPSSGFSFNRCLEESEILADFVLKYLNKEVPVTAYKKSILGGKIPGIEIHLIVSDMLSKFTDPMLNKAIGVMNDLREDFLLSFLTGSDMSIGFAVTTLKAIFGTFSLAEISSLSLKQIHWKNLMNMYNLLPAIPSTNVGKQLIDFVRGIIRKE